MAQAELSPGIESLRGKLAGYSGFQARFKKWKDEFRKDRLRIQSHRGDKGNDSRKRYSILWQYYAKGKKTFINL